MSRYRIALVRIAAGAAVLACAFALSACESRTSEGESGAENDPVAAARDFLTDGVVDHNGFQACGYLTPEQQRVAARRAGGECRWAFDKARLTLGRHHVETVHEVERLPASAAVDGNRARVQLARGGASIDFRLVKASAREQLDQFQPPDTEWRIARGGLAVIPNAAHG